MLVGIHQKQKLRMKREFQMVQLIMNGLQHSLLPRLKKIKIVLLKIKMSDGILQIPK